MAGLVKEIVSRYGGLHGVIHSAGVLQDRLLVNKTVEEVRQAKARGLRVTAEVSPHHLVLSEEALTARPYDTNARTSPPLRSQSDARALLEGLLDGTIDCIASDHTPRRWIDKACEFDQALPGISSLETAFGLLMRLVHAGALSLPQLIGALTHRPAQTWSLPYGTLAPGASAAFNYTVRVR